MLCKHPVYICTVNPKYIKHSHKWTNLIQLGPSYFNAFSNIDGQKNTPKTLTAAKKLGFALAYCDNDASAERENFIGSVFVPGEDKNQGWINADIFGTLVLKE